MYQTSMPSCRGLLWAILIIKSAKPENRKAIFEQLASGLPFQNTTSATINPQSQKSTKAENQKAGLLQIYNVSQMNGFLKNQKTRLP